MRTDDVLCITDKVADESGNVLIDSHLRDGQFYQSTDQLGYPLVGSKVKIIMQYIMRFEGKSFKTEISEPTVSKSNHYR